MVNKRSIGLITAMVFSFLSLSACSLDTAVPAVKTAGEVKKGVQAELSSALVEDRSVYSKDKPDELVNLYVTILKSYDRDGKPVTMTDLNSYRFYEGSESPRLDIIMQEGDENGPLPGSFGYDAVNENAVLESRGHSVQSAAQKSYRIKLYDKAGLWRDQQTINLNKHPYDVTKARNKLSFDYFKLIPNMTSLRTAYIHLHIKDQSGANTDGGFEDMGLYVQIEQPNKRFLRMHGLDSGGNLYKVENFDFYRLPEAIKLADDPAYRKEEFEKYLEIKGSEDHSRLIEMLDDVNDYNLNINDVIDRHFDRDNYITWLASNIIMGNIDVITQNFFLYRPTNSDKWYFLPWDYDGAWGFSLEERSEGIYPPWVNGVERYWQNVLHRRFLKDSDNLKALNDKIDELMKIVTPDKTKAFLDAYHGVVSRFESVPPDSMHLEVTLDQFEKEYSNLYSSPEKCVELFHKSLEAPMPVFLNVPQTVGGKTTFLWDYSYDFQGDDLTYDFQLSTSPSFDKLVYEKKGMQQNTLVIDKPAQGVYYYRVVIKDSKGNTQIAFDTYQDVDDVRYFGVMKFRVE